MTVTDQQTEKILTLTFNQVTALTQGRPFDDWWGGLDAVLAEHGFNTSHDIHDTTAHYDCIHDERDQTITYIQPPRKAFPKV